MPSLTALLSFGFHFGEKKPSGDGCKLEVLGEKIDGTNKVECSVMQGTVASLRNRCWHGDGNNSNPGGWLMVEKPALAMCIKGSNRTFEVRMGKDREYTHSRDIYC